MCDAIQYMVAKIIFDLVAFDLPYELFLQNYVVVRHSFGIVSVFLLSSANLREREIERG